jgi:DNA-binding NarL/FixJ family response regulator
MAADPAVPPTAEHISVVIVDDHTLYRKGLRTQFELDSAIIVIAEFDNAADAKAEIPELQPSVVLMDLHLPWTPGARATHCGARAIAEIKQRWPAARIAVITMWKDDERVLEAIKAGAVSYLTKDGPPDEVIQVVRLTAQGNTMLNGLAMEYVARTLPHSVNGSGSFPGLAKRQGEQLVLAADGCSDKQIAEKLHIAQKTVANNWTYIKQTLGVATRAEAVELARGECADACDDTPEGPGEHG